MNFLVGTACRWCSLDQGMTLFFCWLGNNINTEGMSIESNLCIHQFLIQDITLRPVPVLVLAVHPIHLSIQDPALLMSSCSRHDDKEDDLQKGPPRSELKYCTDRPSLIAEAPYIRLDTAQ
jgi:hypothetical protein